MGLTARMRTLVLRLPCCAWVVGQGMLAASVKTLLESWLGVHRLAKTCSGGTRMDLQHQTCSPSRGSGPSILLQDSVSFGTLTTARLGWHTYLESP